MKEEIIHVIVAPSSWSADNLKYRRHRLSEFLIRQEYTKDVIWVYPVITALRRPLSFIDAVKEIKTSHGSGINEFGVMEYALPDFLPFRYMKYKSNLGSPAYKKLIDIINYYPIKKILWFTCPAFPFIIDSIKWNAIVYDCSDLWTKPISGFTSGDFKSVSTGGLLRDAELKIINNSKIIFATSDYLADIIIDNTGHRPVVIENGVEFENFTKIHDLPENGDVLGHIPRPRLGFVGGMKAKINFNLLDSLAKRNHNWSIVLIGPGPRKVNKTFQRLLKNSNVFWIGAVKPEKVPIYMRHLDVGLLPYRDIDYNKAVFPLKLFEYLSLGLPVVGCGIPSTQKYVQDNVYLHVDSSNFEEACKKTVLYLDYINKDNKIIIKRIKMAKEADWAGKFKLMSDLVLCLADS